MSKRELLASLAEFEAALKKTAGYDTPAEAIGKAIDLLNYLPNGVVFWVEAHGGNRALADKNGKKIRDVVHELGSILSSMPASVVYNVYGMGSPMTFKTRDDLIRAMERMGIKYTGDSSMSGPKRPELQGQPEFDQLVGPMYDGGGKVRYETGPHYEEMSR